MAEQKPRTEFPSDREIISRRTLTATPAQVYAAFAEPARLALWWGPNGFTNTIREFALRPGGKWRLTMRGPDGANYENVSEFVVVEPADRVVFQHLEPVHGFRMMMTFAAHGPQTELTWTMRFDDASEVAKIGKFIGAANQQNFDRLAAHLAGSLNHSNIMTAKAATSVPESTADREIVIARTFHAPRALVWDAWTKPEHVVKWWGPRGFTTETKRHEFRIGGVWEHTMVGPDGTRFLNKSIFKEIVPQERIVYSHGGGREDGEIPGANFTATWTFEALDGGKTKVTGRMLFPSAATRDRVVKEFGAIEGGRQTLERLGEQLAAMQSRPFVIAREFAAPRDLVWKVWTEREHFIRWFGPKGVTHTLVQFDLRPGGMCHYYMTLPDGKKLWGKAAYREVAPPVKLVWINSFSDENAGTTPHPFMPGWPLQVLTVITFAENAGTTTVTVTWLPIDADDDERRVFDDNLASMNGGWGGTFEQLAAYLGEMQKNG